MNVYGVSMIMTADVGRAAAEVLSTNDWAAVAILALALMAHLALYLPLPINDPEPSAAPSVQQQLKKFQAETCMESGNAAQVSGSGCDMPLRPAVRRATPSTHLCDGCDISLQLL